MDKVFGLALADVMVVLVGLLTLALLGIAWLAWRRPVIFKLGVRNIPRRKAQTTLIVVGLMLSTTIIAAALGTGDTLDYSATSEAYRRLGHVDEMVVHSQDVDGNVNAALADTVDVSALALVESTLVGDPNVDGIMPVLDVRVPVVNLATNQGEPTVVLTGVDPSRLEPFGGLIGTDGHRIDLTAIGAGAVVVSEKTAKALDAGAGDTLMIFSDNLPISLRVAAIAKNSVVSGERETALSMVMPLPALQTLMHLPDRLTGVAISNRGGVRDGAAATDAVLAKLRPALAGTQLGVDDVKRDGVKKATSAASLFTSLFLVLGLFSVAAGLLLIVLIFTMLAAERRSEMGMARAVGTHRRQLTAQYVAEGAGYALLAGLVGAALGVLAAIGVAVAAQHLFGKYLTIEPHVTARSLVVAYCLGVLITLVTVVAASWKISRLNVVAAIRDLPDAAESHRRKRTFAWGVLLLAGGALLAVTGIGGKAAIFYAGLSLLPVGLGLILRFFGVAGRPVATTIGLALLTLWLLPQEVADRLFGTLDRGTELSFLAGIFMVTGATIVIVQNTALLLGLVARSGRLFRSKLPAIRIAVAYPGATRGRTGLTIAMFSLIVFSLVMIATMNANFANLFLGDEANAGWDVRVDAVSENPIGDFRTALDDRGVATSDFTAVGVVTNPDLLDSDVRLAGTDDWKRWTVHGMDDAFINHSPLRFGQRATGYPTDADVAHALLTEPDVAVIDVSAVPVKGDLGGNTGFKLTGLDGADKVFAPILIELAAAGGGQPRTVRIIGVIDSKLGTLTGLFAHQSTIDAAYAAPVITSYYVALGHPEQATTVAKAIEAALLRNGAQATSIRDDLKTSQRENAGFLSLIEAFMGLGLFVGVAAIGVVASRSVVERRQQIGLLRALGFPRGVVSLGFLIETAYIVGLGVLSGTLLGLILAHNLFTGDDVNSSGTAFLVPWPTIGAILSATVFAALLMTWLPSRQAARIAPAEALRYE
ncbi:MAG TPA: FtsX-like permease family protein [Thermomicrobiales bacterium]|nr:FtsX-like permease family protein [Thermomicrobiales bacterium]